MTLTGRPACCPHTFACRQHEVRKKCCENEALFRDFEKKKSPQTFFFRATVTKLLFPNSKLK